jgi:RNA polymerase sigma factor (sigma-70 family)
MIYTMKQREKEAPEGAQAQAGSPGFETLFLEHWPRVYRWLYGMLGDPAEAEDLALETFFRLYQRHPSPPEGFNIGGWLWRVATNLGLHSIRSLRRRERHETAGGRQWLEDPAEARPAEILARQEERRLVRRVLAEMKEGQSRMLVMRYSGLSYKEIAEALGVAPSSVGPLLVRAEREFERRCRALLEEEP